MCEYSDELFGKGKLENPVLVNFYKDIESRKLWVDFDITDGLIEFERYIIKWNHEDKEIPVDERKPIKILIYSYGGDVDAILSFIDIVKMSKTPVYTYNMGQCLSAGGLLLMAGHKGHRYGMPASQVLIHEGSVNGVGGDTGKVVDVIEGIKEIQRLLENFIIENTLIDKKIYKKYAKKEWYINSQDSIKYGIIDSIVDDIDMLF